MILLNQMPPKDTYAAKRQTRSSSWYLISNYHFRILLGFACINFNPRSGRNTPGLGAKIPPSLGKVEYWTFSPIPVNFLVILFFSGDFFRHSLWPIGHWNSVLNIFEFFGPGLYKFQPTLRMEQLWDQTISPPFLLWISTSLTRPPNHITELTESRSANIFR